MCTFTLHHTLLLNCLRKRLATFTIIDYFVLEKQHAVMLTYGRMTNTLTFTVNLNKYGYLTAETVNRSAINS